jgi:hypothetical protein
MPRTYHARDWPYIARSARDDAAEEIAAALLSVVPLTEIKSDAETLSRVSKVILHLSNALRLLEAVGAPTKPAPP